MRQKNQTKNNENAPISKKTYKILLFYYLFVSLHPK